MDRRPRERGGPPPLVGVGFRAMERTVGTKRSPHKRDLQRARRRAHDLMRHKRHLIETAAPLEALLREDPLDVHQLLIDRATFLFRAAAAEVNRLKPGVAVNQGQFNREWWKSWDDNGNVVIMPNYWIQYEAELREELAKLCADAAKLNLDERRTRVKEVQTRMLGEALKKACDKAGIDMQQQKLLGSALREELATIEGTVNAE